LILRDGKGEPRIVKFSVAGIHYSSDKRSVQPWFVKPQYFTN